MSVATTDREIEVMRAVGPLLRERRLAEARATVDAALAAGGDSDAMLALAGMVCARVGDPAGARPHLEALLARHPNDRATRLNLTQAVGAVGDHGAVLSVCAPMQGDPAFDRLAAFAAQQQGDAVQARDLYGSVLAAWPDDVDSWANLGNVLDALGQTDPAIDAFERAITLRGTDVRFYLNLAALLGRADRHDARRRVALDAVSVAPRDASAHLELGLAESSLANTNAAVAALRQAIGLAPTDPAAYIELGLLFETTNRLADLNNLITVARPHLGPELSLLEAWAAFRARRFTDARRFARAIPDTVIPMRRYQIQAVIADRLEDSAHAFDLYRRMNEAAVAASPPPPGPTYREMVKRRASRPCGEAVPVSPDNMPEPTFIMGFPRSGTTLFDTIIGTLPNTHVLEEQPFLSAIEHRVEAMGDVATLDAATVAELRAQYLADLLRVAPHSTGKRIVDKHPLHMARMPLIHRLFPTARIFFVQRHPCDVVLSCFMANFNLNAAMRSFTNLEEAARTYDAVLSAWRAARERLDLHVHTIVYERLVAQPEDETRAALGFLGERYEASVLDTVNAAEARGPVRTASYAQITEPIYQRSVARWERYREQMAPVLPILAPWVSNMDYEM